MHEHGHSFCVTRSCLCPGTRPGTRASSRSLGTRFCLGTGGNSHGGRGGIELKITAGELIVSAFVLKKNDLFERLATELKPYGRLK